MILVGDGMADYPISNRGNKTALQLANTPNMDFISTVGTKGVVKTIPEEMDAGSDIAIFSILGYDPARYYTGRGPLEAMGMHISLDKEDIAFRCSLITEKEGKIEDYSGGHITNEEAKELIKVLNEEFRVDGEIEFYSGLSYRNILVLKSYDLEKDEEIGCTPPHEIIGASVDENLPKESILREIILRSKQVLDAHEINIRRADENKKKANMVWLWGGGRKPSIPEFSEMYGVRGSVISAVYLIKGIGRCIGLDVIDVPGATGYIDTNYAGKAEYALRSLKDRDFVFIHVEAPDEASHVGDIDMKVKAIEDFDELVVGNVLKGLQEEFANYGYKILVLPDHYTPVELGTHTKEAVPFAMYHSHDNKEEMEKKKKMGSFDEISAKKERSGLGPGVLDARRLMHYLFNQG